MQNGDEKVVPTGVYENPDVNDSSTQLPQASASFQFSLYRFGILIDSIPKFWTTHPKEWFLKLEAIVSLLYPRKDDLLLYQLVVANIGKDKVIQVADIISNPPDENKYGKIKERLISVYGESDVQKVLKWLKNQN